MIQEVNSIKNVGAILNISHQTVYNEINAGRLKTFRIRRRRYVSQEALIQYIKERERESMAG